MVDDVRERVLAAIRGRGDNAAFDALLSDGLLRTGNERECVEACKRHHVEYPAQSRFTGPCWRCSHAGRSAIEAERPKEPRYLRCDCGERRMADGGSTGAGTGESHSLTICERAEFAGRRFDRIKHDSRLPVAERPKERWTVDSDCYIVDSRCENRWIGAPQFNALQARAVAKALNALEREAK